MSGLARWLQDRYGGPAAFYEKLAATMEKAGVGAVRARLAGGLRGRIVEIGCGTGLNFPHYDAGAEVMAVEPLAEFRDLACERASAAAADIQVCEGDAQALPFSDGSFDAGIVTLVFCSIPDAARGLAELRRVVRPGGEVLLFEHVRSESPLVRSAQHALDPLWWRMMDGCHVNRDTAAAVRAAGFQVEAVEPHQLPGVAGMLFPMIEVRARA